MFVEVALTAQEIPTYPIQDKSVVVIDVLRATSAMITALVNGCRAVIPVRDLDRAWAIKEKAEVLLGGERHCVKIPGFDFGNSPLEYKRERVQGRKIVFCTTNGTLALVNSQEARVLALGAFLNAKAIAPFLVEKQNPVLLACAGTRGEFTLEDFLAAGCIIHQLKNLGASLELSDKAVAAHGLYLTYKDNLHEALLLGRHGKRLSHLGFGEDVAYCAQTNLFPVVPIYRKGRITLA